MKAVIGLASAGMSWIRLARLPSLASPPALTKAASASVPSVVPIIPSLGIAETTFPAAP